MKYKPEPGVFRCDCVKYKKAIQAKIYEETKYMTPEEQMEYIRQGSQAFRAEMEQLRKEREAEKGQ
jgi:uncharacterized protein (UPF0305 family)